MRTPRQVAPGARQRDRQWISLSLAILLLLPVVPVSAAGSASDRGIELHLEQVFALQGETFELTDVAPDAFGSHQRGAAPSSARAHAFAQTDLTSLRDTSVLHQAADEKDLSDRARGKRGFGRWLKKYWYVPVLVAGAAVALSSDDSDDPNEIDD